VAVDPVAARGNGEVMPRTRSWIAFGLLLTASALLAQTDPPVPAKPAARKHKSHKAPKPVVLPPLPPGPLSQLPMDQMPPAPAKVSFQDGLLTIAAQNSTLSEILRDVRKLTGASIEIPQGPNANERVVAYLGPGAPRDVLAGLLNGSSFNYVMLGSASDPAAVSSVVLMAKPSSPGQTQTATNVYENSQPAMPPSRYPQPFSQGQVLLPQAQNAQPGTAQAATADADDSKDDDEKDDDSSADDQAQPGQPGQAAAAPDQQPPDPNQPNAGPKTPEQILEMLRRQQPGSAVIPPPQPPQQ
jgi:hypothetical protein